MKIEGFESRNQKPVAERFWSSVRKSDGCWEWEGYRKNGYGSMRVAGKNDYAHRISWLINFGEYPGDLCVLHRCDNPGCVRPDHLFLGTRKDNSIDAARKGRNAAQRRPEIRRGENGSMVKLSESEVRAIRAEYAAGIGTYQEIAERYGVEKSTIGKIVNRQLWAHVI